MKGQGGIRRQERDKSVVVRPRQETEEVGRWIGRYGMYYVQITRTVFPSLTQGKTETKTKDAKRRSKMRQRGRGKIRRVI